MKLVRQSRLVFRSGNSDKVYEVDLCEVGPDRFVVNFRFGRSGSQLKEGTKTDLPVGRSEADRAFQRLVDEKIRKGYVDAGAGAGTAGGEEEEEDEFGDETRVEDVADPRGARLVELLQGNARGWTSSVDKLIWRAGSCGFAQRRPSSPGSCRVRTIGGPGTSRGPCCGAGIPPRPRPRGR